MDHPPRAGANTEALAGSRPLHRSESPGTRGMADAGAGKKGGTAGLQPVPLADGFLFCGAKKALATASETGEHAVPQRFSTGGHTGRGIPPGDCPRPRRKPRSPSGRWRASSARPRTPPVTVPSTLRTRGPRTGTVIQTTTGSADAGHRARRRRSGHDANEGLGDHHGIPPQGRG